MVWLFFDFCNVRIFLFFGNIDGVNDAIKKRPKKSVVPPSGNKMNLTKNGGKKHSSTSAHTMITICMVRFNGHFLYIAI
jgi:hypothetical protein